MDKCCISNNTPRTQRRINGLQLPLNWQQIIGWIVFVATGMLNFLILIEIQFIELRIISLITFVVLYACHVASHFTALLTDPSEKELRKLKVNDVPEFDRSIHAHVIENGRCHLCNIHTSSRHTKHCSLCNKCVDHFDHHCKWLNNCVGQRNYTAFITCVTTALLIAIFTSSLCFTDIVLFLAYPQRLSYSAQNFINCSSVLQAPSYGKYCRNSISFLTFLILFCTSAFAISCALLHLCCFHVYISMLGVSTYEYIVKVSTSKSPQRNCYHNCRCSNIYMISKTKKKNRNSTYKSDNTDSETSHDKTTEIVRSNETNVRSLITILITNELNRARKMFFYEKNKVHPQNESNSS